MRLLLLVVSFLTMATAMCDGNATLSVTGIGSSFAPPDMATISVGVSTLADAAQQALTDNNAAMAAIMAILKGAPYNITDKDIQTNGFSIFQELDYNTYPNVPIGYRVNNNVNAVLRKLDQLGGLLDALVQGGSNQISGVSFGFSDTATLLTQAREAAIEDAKAKAAWYSMKTGATLGDLIFVGEPGAANPVNNRNYAEEDMGGGVPIASGQQEVTASINLVYALVAAAP